VVSRDPGYLFERPALEVVRLLLSMPFERWLRGLQGMLGEPRRTASFYPVARLNDHGDQTLNDEATWSEAERAAIKLRRQTIEPEIRVGAHRPDPSELAKVKQLAEWSRAHGVHLFVAWPTFINAPQYAEPKYRLMFDGLVEFFRRNDIAVLGSYRDELVDDMDLIYDSENHLTDAARALRTERMIKALRDQKLAPLRGSAATG
jgi:hypothetical protein